MGLLDAAVATGSIAIPFTEPAPVGLASAYAAQPGPTSEAGSAEALEPEVISDEVIGADAAVLEDESELSSEHPATSPTARPTPATVTASR
jgi:hypothetical protein